MIIEKEVPFQRYWSEAFWANLSIKLKYLNNYMLSFKGFYGYLNISLMYKCISHRILLAWPFIGEWFF